jgi:sugar lactone lactonase YvrE
MTSQVARLGSRTSAVILALALAGCGGGGGGSAATGGAVGTGGSGATGATGGGCPTGTGSGTLSFQISGTPNGGGSVALDSGEQVTSSTALSLPAGPRAVTAYLVAVPGALVRTAYTPTVDQPAPCVVAGQTTTVHVDYSLIETSGLVWTGLSNGSTSATLLGFDAASVTGSGEAAAAVAADAHGADGFTFDRQGNIWVTGATVSDPAIARYPAAMFATSGTMTPDLTLDSPAFSGGTPGAKVLAFDNQGNLWASVVWSGKVVKFSAAQLASGGSKTPVVEESGFNAPAGIAVDAAGNMWVASSGDDLVVRIDASHLAASGSGADFAVTAVSAGLVANTLASPLGLAFDGSGNLWVNYDGTIAELPASALSGAGPLTLAPPVQLNTDPTALPTGIAFDEAGGLWLAYTSRSIARFDPAQLTGQGPVVPATVITSADIGASGSAGWFAIYPAPAFTPLAHAFD